jgi:hypothetical protein
LISSFPIYLVEPKDRYGTNTSVDAEGRFYKYWCNHPELGHCLFKAASPDGFTPKVTSQFTIDLLDFNLQNLLSGSERLIIEQTDIDVQEDLRR